MTALAIANHPQYYNNQCLVILENKYYSASVIILLPVIRFWSSN